MCNAIGIGGDMGCYLTEVNETLFLFVISTTAKSQSAIQTYSQQYALHGGPVLLTEILREGQEA
jgi:hypothetical protein